MPSSSILPWSRIPLSRILAVCSLFIILPAHGKIEHQAEPTTAPEIALPGCSQPLLQVSSLLVPFSIPEESQGHVPLPLLPCAPRACGWMPVQGRARWIDLNRLASPSLRLRITTIFLRLCVITFHLLLID